MTAAQMIGWAHTAFGRAPEPDVEALMAQVSAAALADAGLGADDVGFVSVGVFGNGFSRQRFHAALVGAGTPHLALVPAARAENACATGSAAVFAALDAIESGRVRVALVVLHGCTIGDETLIGMSATVLDGATIGPGSLVAAGAVVPGGAEIPPGSLVAGVPARVRRRATDQERAFIQTNAREYLRHAAEHRDALVRLQTGRPPGPVQPQDARPRRPVRSRYADPASSSPAPRAGEPRRGQAARACRPPSTGTRAPVM